MNRRRILELFVERWLEQVSRLDYTSLSSSQPRPHASIACGAAGIAVALTRASHRLRRPELRAAATTWATVASRARRNDFLNRASGISGLADSLWYGPEGARAISAALSSSLDVVPMRPFRHNDVLGGRAGWMPLFLLVEAHGLDPRHADGLARSLLRSRAYGITVVGFAHGRLGIQHALLGWATRRRRPLALPFWKTVRQSATLDPRTLGTTALSRSWCNGSAGLVMTLAAAYQLSGDGTFLVAARRAGPHVAGRADGPGGDLCCGNAGRAYALATLHRIDPSGNWLERAWELALQALAFAGGRWPNGLLKGWPGLVCLILDLLEGEVAFPLVQTA